MAIISRTWSVILFATQLLFASLVDGCDLTVPSIQFNDTLFVNNRTEFSRWWPYREPKNCTSVRGSVSISPDYSGNLTFNAVTDVSGALYNTRGLIGANVFGSSLGNFTANELVSVGVLQLQSTRRLSVLTLPRLEFAREIFLDNIATKFLVLPSLRNASRVSLGNLVTSWTVNPAPIIDLPALETVDDHLHVNSELAKRESYRSLLSTSVGLLATFPSLVYCGNLFIFGSLQLVSLPKLSCIGCNEAANASIGFSVENIGRSLLPIRLPNLTESSAITISGNIHSITIPVLQNVSRQFEINSTSKQLLDIDLPDLKHAGKIQLRGNITRVNLPSLQSFTSINIQSNYSKIDCASPIAAYERIHNTTYNAKNNAVDSDFYCGVFSDDKRKVARRRRISLGVGLGLGLPAALLLSAYLYIRQNKSFQSARGDVNGVDNDSPVHVAAHELRTVRPGSVRSGRSVKTVLPPYERGQAPPEYSAGTSAAGDG